MKLLLTFLVAMFVVGGTATKRQPTWLPLAILATCVVVGAMFYGRRFL